MGDTSVPAGSPSVRHARYRVPPRQVPPTPSLSTYTGIERRRGASSVPSGRPGVRRASCPPHFSIDEGIERQMGAGSGSSGRPGVRRARCLPHFSIDLHKNPRASKAPFFCHAAFLHKIVEKLRMAQSRGFGRPRRSVHSIGILEVPGVFLARRWRRC